MKSDVSTFESSRPIVANSTTQEGSSGDFAAIVAAMVCIEFPDEEMVDYEPSLARGEMNVVYLSFDIMLCIKRKRKSL